MHTLIHIHMHTSGAVKERLHLESHHAEAHTYIHTYHMYTYILPVLLKSDSIREAIMQKLIHTYIHTLHAYILPVHIYLLHAYIHNSSAVKE